MWNTHTHKRRKILVLALCFIKHINKIILCKAYIDLAKSGWILIFKYRFLRVINIQNLWVNDIAIFSTQNITCLHAMVRFTPQPDTASLKGLNNYCKQCLVGGDDDLFISFPISSLYVMMMNLILTEIRTTKFWHV